MTSSYVAFFIIFWSASFVALGVLFPMLYHQWCRIFIFCQQKALQKRLYSL